MQRYVLLGAIWLFTTNIFPNSIESLTKKLQSFNHMRENLASSLNPQQEKIGLESFKKTCQPVGVAMKEWAKLENLHLRQLSIKNRNPSNAPLEDELEILTSFIENPKQNILIKRRMFNSKLGKMIYVRIPVTAECLHCHGPKESRPNFIIENYPQDKAYDFKAGDLRGVYALFVEEGS